MPFAATWMDLEIIILNEVSQRKISIWYHSYVGSSLKKKKWTSLQNRNRLRDIENKLTVTKKEMWRGERNQKLGMNTHTARTYCIAQGTVFNTL